MQQSNYNYPTKLTCDIDGVIFNSAFDSGNLGSVKKDLDYPNKVLYQEIVKYNLTIKEDSGQNGKTTSYRTWFYFSVEGVEVGTLVTFCIKNMSNQSRLYKEGMVPVVKTQGSGWQRIKNPVQLTQIGMNSGPIEITFKHQFDEQIQTFFAFTYPWTLEENEDFMQRHMETISDVKDIYINRTPLIYSKEGRKVELITISSKRGMSSNRESNLNCIFPDGNAPYQFDKKYIFVSARVHPGEVPSSHVMNGLINTLLDKNNQNSDIARDNFVWVLVPFLNPDGVYRGHYRTDSNCLNLNRYYVSPSQTEHPSVYAVKEYLMRLHHQNKLYAYIDLHAHAAHKGIFIFGNSLPNVYMHNLSCMFPRLVSFYSEIFDYEGCNFTEKNMHQADKSDGLSKDGAGRVALYKATNLIHSYTLECNYNTGRVTNILHDITYMQPQDIPKTYGRQGVDLDTALNTPFYNTKQETYFYKISDFQGVGYALVNAFLDLNLLNVQSRLPASQFQTLNNVKFQLGNNIAKQMPYRLDPFIRKVQKNLSNKEMVERTQAAFISYIETGEKIDNLEGEVQQPPMTRYQKAQELKQKKQLQQLEPKQLVLNTEPQIQDKGNRPKARNSQIHPNSTSDIDKKNQKDSVYFQLYQKRQQRVKSEGRRSTSNPNSRADQIQVQPINQFRIKKNGSQKNGTHNVA